MHALITGGAGFIGGHLAKRLIDDGHHVTMVDNLSRGVSDAHIAELSGTGRFTTVIADLRDPHALDSFDADITHIFHFAALLGVANVIERPYPTLRDNVSMVANMIDYAKRLDGLERFVFPSTSEVYVGTQQFFELPIPSPESTPLAVSALDQPRTSYMLSKIYGEALCQHSGLPFTIVRPHNFYGPRMGLSHVVPQLLQRIFNSADGDELVVYSMEHQRTFCYIDDAIGYLTALASHEAATGGTFNIGVQAPEVRIGELAEVLCEVVGRDLHVVPGETTAGSPFRRCPDMAHTIGVTGMNPTVTLVEGVRRTFDWYRTNVFEGGSTTAV